jgi:hypothetical protein
MPGELVDLDDARQIVIRGKLSIAWRARRAL